MADTKDLGTLHALLARHLLNRIKKGETIVTKKGEVIDIEVSPSVLNVARAFLKDNDIGVDDDVSDGVKALAEQVRELGRQEDEDEDTSRLN